MTHTRRLDPKQTDREDKPTQDFSWGKTKVDLCLNISRDKSRDLNLEQKKKERESIE